MIQKPIPNLSLSDWKSIPIIECGEVLVELNSLNYKRIIAAPKYFQQNVPGSIDKCFVRESIAKKLEKVVRSLPPELVIVVWDSWRSIATQQALFDSFKENISQTNPGLSENDIIKLTSVYVSLPSRFSDKPSPHNTGGAIDLTIGYDDGILLDMGTDFDDFSPKAKTTYFEHPLKNMSDKFLHIRKNRRLLYQTMVDAGFTNYPEEWWHFDYGNQFWAAMSGAPNAIYGMITPNP